jgi:3-dehydroquinate dehydratase
MKLNINKQKKLEDLSEKDENKNINMEMPLHEIPPETISLSELDQFILDVLQQAAEVYKFGCVNDNKNGAIKLVSYMKEISDLSNSSVDIFRNCTVELLKAVYTFKN